MDNNKYLNEKSYKKTVTILTIIAILILIVGLSFGITKILKAKTKPDKAAALKIELETKKSELESLYNQQLESAKQILETKKIELKSKGIKESSDYNNGEAYDLYVINNALDPSYNSCNFSPCIDNELTKNYCSLKNKSDENSKNITVISNILSDTDNSYCSWDDYRNNELAKEYLNANCTNIDDTMIGIYICAFSCFFTLVLLLIASRRKMMAFNTQAVMPIAKESINEMTPPVTKIAADIAKEMAPVVKDIAKEMTPVYKDIAKEVSKGIKEGLKDDEEK